jgi:holliday junction DNA helicase RuvA
VISRIRGKLVSLSEGRAELKCGLVHYEVMVPGYLESELEARLDQPVEFFTLDYLEGSQGAQQIPRLVGFGSEQERKFFEFLLKVPGMGIRTSLRVLKISPSRFAQIIESGEPAMLAELPGIGKKTAERIIAELKGKLGPFLSAEALRPMALGEDEITAVSVLVNLGIRPIEAEELVKKVRATGVSSRNDLVAGALKERGRKTTEVVR